MVFKRNRDESSDSEYDAGSPTRPIPSSSRNVRPRASYNPPPRYTFGSSPVAPNSPPGPAPRWSPLAQPDFGGETSFNDESHSPSRSSTPVPSAFPPISTARSPNAYSTNELDITRGIGAFTSDDPPSFTGTPSPSTPPSNAAAQVPDSSPLSVLITATPAKGRGTQGGRPRASRLQKTRGSVSATKEKERRQREIRQRLETAQQAASAREESRRKLERLKLQEDILRAQRVLEKACQSEDEGGFGFRNMAHFFGAVLKRGGAPEESQFSANLTRWVRDHGQEFIEDMSARHPATVDAVIDAAMEARLQKEGQAIQAYFTSGANRSIIPLLESFSMQHHSNTLENEIAPTMWKLLLAASNTPRGETRRERSLVLTCICAMISIMRSERANDFQVTMGLFLLGSGASKREISVFAHAGLSLAYNTILNHLKTMSSEATDHYRRVVKECVCALVWDNLNIAFRVGEQRLDRHDHFDNGTTSTLFVQYGGSPEQERLPHGYLPFSMKPPRVETKPTFDWDPENLLPSPESAKQLSASCIWQVKRLALSHIPGLDRLQAEFDASEPCPVVEQIPVHKTEHYPLPALNIEESSIDGTIEVYETILKHLQMSDVDLEKHGIMLDDGDLLTELLKDKVDSARRNSQEPIAGRKGRLGRMGIFHTKMAGGRMTANEHWGKPNSKWPGSLWWESKKILERKAMTAGWKGKKATPWRPVHELLHISLPAHIVDGFRIHCGADTVEEWAKTATLPEVNRVAELVYHKLFATEVVEDLRDADDEDRDRIHENVILYNRDALLYIEFVHAVKWGDIGRVLNVLNMWMIMMRAVSTMPKYADAIFQVLGELKTMDPILRKIYVMNWLVNISGKPGRFKEVDLLQEHQNFWAKIIYNAKGSSKSWKWLGMITVVIWTLRDAMRTVQKSFDIPELGLKHTSPEITKEIQAIVNALRADKIQEYVRNRPGNDEVESVRDLIDAGVQYANTRKAYSRFRPDTRRARNVGVVVSDDHSDDDEEDQEDGREEEMEDEGPTDEDLDVDDDEDYANFGGLLSRASNITDDIFTAID